MLLNAFGMVMLIGGGMWGTQATTAMNTLYYEAEPVIEHIIVTGESQGARIDALRAFLEDQNAQLMIQYVDEIVELPRYIEVVAIIGHETSFCTKGVGESRNNCGAIMNTKGEFKRYASKLDAIEDLSILLQNDRYGDLTIEQMNGIYCVHEGGVCPDWTENINRYIRMIELAGK